MILFKPEHVKPILRREKTQTRRLGNKRWNVGAVHQCKLNFMKGEPFARVRILGVRKERLGSITPAGARAEGYASAHEYLMAFHKINRVPLEAATRVKVENAMVWAVDFELVEEDRDDTG